MKFTKAALVFAFVLGFLGKAIAQFPSLNPDILRSRIEKFIEHCENNLEENQS
jgi:hypothetical protein